MEEYFDDGKKFWECPNCDSSSDDDDDDDDEQQQLIDAFIIEPAAIALGRSEKEIAFLLDPTADDPIQTL